MCRTTDATVSGLVSTVRITEIHGAPWKDVDGFLRRNPDNPKEWWITYSTNITPELRLALLAPDIVQAAFEGKLPRTMSLESLLRTTFPLDWNKQREMIASLGTPV